MPEQPRPDRSAHGTEPPPPGVAVGLRLSRLENLRELGGIPVSAGRLRPGLLWRADDVSLASDDQLAELAAAGVRGVVDLRSAQERRATGRGRAGRHGLQGHYLPLTQDVADPEVMAAVFERTRRPDGAGAWYASLVEERAADLVRGLGIIADTPGGTVVHCAAGKDRTGVVIAAVLATLGASEEHIVADYARTDGRIAAVLTRLRSAGHVAAHEDGMRAVDRSHAMLRAPAATMEAMLVRLDGAAGLRARLEAAGLGEELAARLRRRLVDAE